MNMEQVSRFDNSFWVGEAASVAHSKGIDPVNFSGFDNLCEIMKNGKHTCDDFQNFVKQRFVWSVFSALKSRAASR